MPKLTRDGIAYRAAQDLQTGIYVNLGVGLPTRVANHIPADREVMCQSENGILGVGPAPSHERVDQNVVNASLDFVTVLPGGSFFSHADSFMMIRGGHIDIAMLGAFQVSEAGDLANWTTGNPDDPPAVGGAMDLAGGAKAVWVLMEHTTKDGRPRIVPCCSYPLTGRHVVRRIFTDLAVIDVTDNGLIVRESIEEFSLEFLQSRTGARLHVADDWQPLVDPRIICDRKARHL